MAITFQNNYDGGTNEVAVSTANSGGGSGNAWDAITVSNGATCTYTNTQSVSTPLGGRYVTAATSGVCYSRWNFGYTEWWGSLNVFIRSAWVDGVRVVSGNDASNARISSMSINGDRTITVRNGADVTVGSTTATLALNAWSRLEWHFLHNATTGVIEARIYNSPTSPTIVEQISLSNQNAGTALAHARFGITLGGANDDVILDDVKVSNTGFIGAPSASGRSKYVGYLPR